MSVLSAANCCERMEFFLELSGCNRDTSFAIRSRSCCLYFRATLSFSLCIHRLKLHNLYDLHVSASSAGFGPSCSIMFHHIPPFFSALGFCEVANLLTCFLSQHDLSEESEESEAEWNLTQLKPMKPSQAWSLCMAHKFREVLPSPNAQHIPTTYQPLNLTQPLVPWVQETGSRQDWKSFQKS